MQPCKAVFLYTELAGYTLACLRELSKKGFEVVVFHYPVNKEAPFKFKAEANIQFYNRFDFDLLQLSEKIINLNPALIICSGWIDKEYLKICAKWKSKCKTVLALDTKWEGLWRQYVATVVSPFAIKKNFDYAWVPGTLQAIYAQKLGFPKDKIYKGFYACDYPVFSELYTITKTAKNNKLPHCFIYVGRYYQFKGIQDLWEAFIALQDELPNDWELWCLGTGDITPVTHPKIKHFGFVQPEAMEKFIANTGVFILPSHKEPWGVVVQEFAAAGFPLLCSNKVGAAEVFLEHNKNGYIFEAGNVLDLKNSLIKIVKSSNQELLVMANESVSKAAIVTPATWADTLITIANE